MAIAAAKEAVEALPPGTIIDLVLVASGTTLPVLHPPEPENPGTADIAPRIIAALGLQGALGLDLKACYCTGFLRCLEVADAMLARGRFKTALIIAAEQGSRMATAASNRSSFSFIAGDAAGAAILQRRSGEGGVLRQVGFTAGDKLHLAGVGPDGMSMVMRGTSAATITHEMLVSCAKQLLDAEGLTPDDIDHLIPIQTHAQVLAAFCDATRWPEERLRWFGDQWGFSGSSSIPSALAHCIELGVVRPGDRILSLAVGAGMNCAGALYQL